MEAARFPLDKRPLQVFNLRLAFNSAQAAGVDLKVPLTMKSTTTFASVKYLWHIKRNLPVPVSGPDHPSMALS